MDDKFDSLHRWLKWALIAAGWTLFALFFASETIVSRAYVGRPLLLRETVLAWLICSYLWFALTPFVLRVAHGFPLERSRWLANALVHLGASAVLAVLQLAFYVLIARWAGLEIGRTPYFSALRNQFIYGVHFALITYWVIVGFSQALDYYRKFRERERRALQLEARLAQAELDALKMQLHPHFLFNTLNSISVLMGEDVKAARRMLTRLSDLLRTSLDSAGRQEVTLKEELEFLTSYLEIEQTRFQDRLTVSMNIDPATFSARVPNFILQPLVENAIRHGIAPRAAPGSVEVQAVRQNGMMQLQVSDNGAGLGSGDSKKLTAGIGLSNTRARLEQMYGVNHRFEIRETDGGGLTVTITIPFETQANANKDGKEQSSTPDSRADRR